jgi:hypothetical protein
VGVLEMSLVFLDKNWNEWDDVVKEEWEDE